MSLYKFDSFVFDSTRYHLTHRGESVSVRPKALCLLKLLIEERHRLVSKSEITTMIWGSNYVRDYLLFQLISELRKLPFCGELIRTQPNKGYQWNVSTKCIQKNRVHPKLVAASIALGLMCLLIPFDSPVVENSNDNSAQLPAHSAFSKGVLAMENGRNNQAIKWFEFSIAENPESIQSSIFLAEALYKNNETDESTELLLSLQNQSELSAYDKMTTNQMLSRINQKQGKMFEALRYVQNFSPEGVVGQCSIASVNNRVLNLKSQLGLESSDKIKELDNKAVTSNNASPIVSNIADECKQLEHNVDDTSLCIPENNTLLYAIKDEEQKLQLS